MPTPPFLIAITPCSDKFNFFINLYLYRFNIRICLFALFNDFLSEFQLIRHLSLFYFHEYSSIITIHFNIIFILYSIMQFLFSDFSNAFFIFRDVIHAVRFSKIHCNQEKTKVNQKTIFTYNKKIYINIKKLNFLSMQTFFWKFCYYENWRHIFSNEKFSL